MPAIDTTPVTMTSVATSTSASEKPASDALLGFDFAKAIHRDRLDDGSFGKGDCSAAGRVDDVPRHPSLIRAGRAIRPELDRLHHSEADAGIEPADRAVVIRPRQRRVVRRRVWKCLLRAPGGRV